jgi:Flp pilus assembly protein TadD
MVTFSKRVRAGLAFAAFLGVAWLGPLPSAEAAACSGPPGLQARLRSHPDADTYAALGKWFGENHKPDCAAQAFQSGLKLEPDSALLNYLFGLSLYAAGQMQEAVAPLRRSVQLHPQELKAHLLLGDALSRLNRDREALPEWETALKIDPSSKIALDGLAKSLISLGDFEAAINRLHSAPRDETLTLDLAIAYGKAGKSDDAAQVLAEGVNSYPDSAALTKALEGLYVDKNRYREAFALAEKFVGRNPRDMEAQHIFLHLMVENGDFDEALPLARKLLALAPHDADLLKANGMLERLAGDYPAARKHLEEAVAQDPKDRDARSKLGIVLSQLHDNAGARVQLEKAIELGSKEPEVYFELAKTLRALGKTGEAQQQLVLYQQALKAKSDRTEANLKSMQAAQAVKEGDNRKAADLYREACAVLPENAELAYRLAQVLDSLGDIAGERAALEQAVKADPKNARAQYQLGYLEYQAGENAAAERQFRLAVKAAPGYFDAWVSLATTLDEESRFQEAREAVATALKLQPDDADALQLSKSLATAPDRH